MRKQTANLEWHIAESETEREQQQALRLPEVAPASSRRLRQQRYLWIVVTTLLLLSSVGGWWHHTAPVQLQADEAELLLAIEQKPLAVHSASPATDQNVALQTTEIQGRQAVVQAASHTGNGRPAYRQTLFYRHTPTGWLRTDPDAALWGAERSLETPYFVYRFGEKDEVTVLAVAPQLDALYTNLRRNFGLAIDPTPEKRVIDLHVTQPPGQVTVFDGVNPSPWRHRSTGHAHEYAVATYGQARLPVLVAGLGRYKSWETLIPAVYGVSAAEFEARWQAYLTAHYGVAAEHA